MPEQQLETAPVETAIEQPVAEPTDLAMQIEALRSKNTELIQLRELINQWPVVFREVNLTYATQELKLKIQWSLV